MPFREAIDQPNEDLLNRDLWCVRQARIHDGVSESLALLSLTCSDGGMRCSQNGIDEGGIVAKVFGPDPSRILETPHCGCQIGHPFLLPARERRSDDQAEEICCTWNNVDDGPHQRVRSVADSRTRRFMLAVEDCAHEPVL